MKAVKAFYVMPNQKTGPYMVVAPTEQVSVCCSKEKGIGYLGLNPANFGILYCRTGEKISTALEGFDPQRVQTLGRWKLDCYRSYVRSTDGLLGHAKSMS